MLYDFYESAQLNCPIDYISTCTCTQYGAKSSIGASQLLTGSVSLCSAVCCPDAGSAGVSATAVSAAGSAAGPLTVVSCFVLSSLAYHPEPQHSGDRTQRRALPTRQPRVLGHTQPGEKHLLFFFLEMNSIIFFVCFIFSVPISQLLQSSLIHKHTAVIHIFVILYVSIVATALLNCTIKTGTRSINHCSRERCSWSKTIPHCLT